MSSHNPVVVDSSAYTLIYDSTSSGFSGNIQLIGGSSCVCRIASSLPSAGEGGFVVAPQSAINIGVSGGEKLYAKSQSGSSIIILIDGNLVNLVNGGSAVSSSNPLPTVSARRQSAGEASLKGYNFKGIVLCAATASKNSSVQIWNPADSGFVMLVSAASAYISSGTSKLYPIITHSPLATNNGYTHSTNSAEPVAHFQMRSDALSALTTTSETGINVASTTPTGAGLIMSGEFYVLLPNSGLSYENSVVNISTTLTAMIIEIPLSEL